MDVMPSANDKPDTATVIPFVSRKTASYNALLAMKIEEQREVLAQFCRYCASDDPRCLCWTAVDPSGARR